jgi:hypothetical protein
VGKRWPFLSAFDFLKKISRNIMTENIKNHGKGTVFDRLENPQHAQSINF